MKKPGSHGKEMLIKKSGIRAMSVKVFKKYSTLYNFTSCNCRICSSLLLYYRPISGLAAIMNSELMDFDFGAFNTRRF